MSSFSDDTPIGQTKFFSKRCDIYVILYANFGEKIKNMSYSKV